MASILFYVITIKYEPASFRYVRYVFKILPRQNCISSHMEQFNHHPKDDTISVSRYIDIPHDHTAQWTTSEDLYTKYK